MRAASPHDDCKQVGGSRWSRRPIAGRAPACALLLALGGPVSGGADPVPVAARVVWVQVTRVYVAASDSLPLASGDVVTFSRRERVIASGVVERVVDRHLAVVDILSGTLAREKRPERLRVLAERPTPGALPVLRVGCPDAGRAPASVPCERQVFRPPLPEGAYRTDSSAPRVTRVVRDPSVVVGAPWPDTLEIRLFDEITDQEIALERGELDIAVFWPGELSRHMREQPRWADPLLGTWTGAAADSATAAPIECPVLCEARLLPTLRALGVDALVNVLACPREPREP